MTYGAHIYLWQERWIAEAIPLLERARDLGLEFVEVAVGDDYIFDAARIGQAAADLGLAMSASPGGIWPMECDLSLPDPAHRALGQAWHRRMVDQTAALGGMAYTGALYGHPGHVERRKPTADEYKWMAEGLHELAAYAAPLGVEIVIEPMSHFRTHLVNRPEQAMHLLELADQPNLGILLDTYHLTTEVRDYAAAMRTAAPRLWGIHACESDRGVLGGGIVPWEAVAAGLRAGGFDGYVGLESYNSSDGDFAERRGLFNDPCPNGDEFVNTGLAFMRGLLEG